MLIYNLQHPYSCYLWKCLISPKEKRQPLRSWEDKQKDCRCPVSPPPPSQKTPVDGFASFSHCIPEAWLYVVQKGEEFKSHAFI